MKFRLVIDVPEETILNYQRWAKDYTDLFNELNLEEFIKDTVQDQTQWDVEQCSLLDKKEFNQLKKNIKK